MSNTTAANAPLGRCVFSPGILGLLLGLPAALVAVSGQSLWIDEANAAVKAIAPTWSIFWKTMQTERGSDLQMPLYMLMLWGWEKIFGHSEFALRALNIPLFVIALAVLGTLPRMAKPTRLFAILFACTSPFLWAYLDEARPYILQFLAATAALVPLTNLCLGSNPPQTRDLAVFTLGIVLLCASSLIGVIYSLLFGTTFLLLWVRREPWRSILARRDLQVSAVVGGIFLALLAAYYAWTLQAGAKASGVAKTNVFSIGFALYEFLGFSGLGPSRSVLRDNPITALAPHLAILAGYVAVWALFLVFALLGTHSLGLGKVMPLVLAAAASFVAIVLLGRIGEFRIVGRHFMPLYPFLLLGVSALATAAWQSGRWIPRSAVVLLLSASLASAATYRFASRHGKDDYRGAAETARGVLQAGGVVWWAADRAAANFYGVYPQVFALGGTPLMATPPLIFMANNRDAEYLAHLPDPDLVILSKHDVYDSSGYLREFLIAHEFSLIKKLAAFEVFAKPSL